MFLSSASECGSGESDIDDFDLRFSYRRTNVNKYSPLCIAALLCKSMDWFLYDRELRHERVSYLCFFTTIDDHWNLRFLPSSVWKYEHTKLIKLFYFQDC